MLCQQRKRERGWNFNCPSKAKDVLETHSAKLENLLHAKVFSRMISYRNSEVRNADRIYFEDVIIFYASRF